MTPAFRLTTAAGRRGALALLLAAPALLAGCHHDALVAPAPDDYFPLTLNTYRSYAVTDSVWRLGVLSVSSFQLREVVREQFADAAGRPAYRLVRARRAAAGAAWVDDSVLLVQPLPRAVVLTRDNVRTVELIYPAQAGKAWPKYAFTTTRGDSVRAFDGAVGQAFTTPGPAPQTYAATATVRDQLPVEANDGLYRRSGLRQVYARGVGLVLRRRYSYSTFTTDAIGVQTPTPGRVQNGAARYEVLLETGTL